MDGKALLNFVDLMHRDKNISRENVFAIIEQAVRLATEKYFGEKGLSDDIAVAIDRASGTISARKGEQEIDRGDYTSISATHPGVARTQKTSLHYH